MFGKDKTKLSVFADDILVYVENSKEILKELLGFKSLFRKNTGYT